MAEQIARMTQPAKRYHVEAVKEQVKVLKAASERTESMMMKLLETMEKLEGNMKDMEVKYEERLRMAQRAREVQLSQLRHVFNGGIKHVKGN